MLSRTVYKKRRGRRLLTAMALSLVAGLFAAGTVLAVHDRTSSSTDASIAVRSARTVCKFQKDWAKHGLVGRRPNRSPLTAVTATNGTFTNATFAETSGRARAVR